MANFNAIGQGLGNLNYLLLGQEVSQDQEKLLYFDDGIRKIDFVLVAKISQEEDSNKVYHRRKFIEQLKQKGIGLELAKNVTEDESGYINFYKCHCPTNLLMYYAEKLNFKIPLKLDNVKTSESSKKNGKGDIKNWSGVIFKMLRVRNPMEQDVPNPPPTPFTANFKAENVNNFSGGENPSTMFTDAQRSRIMFEILETTKFGDRHQRDTGISSLLHTNVFEAAYPLHQTLSDETTDDQEFENSKCGMRQVLRNYWANWSCWYKYQPLDHIREYFGEKLALYFAWLGHYTTWLFLPAIVGLIVFMYGLVTMDSSANQNALDICNSKNWEYRMCPLCEEKLHCVYWDLKGSCFSAKISYLSDNGGTVFFAVFLSFWAVFFQEFWKRRESKLAFHWSCNKYEAATERPRPAFIAGTSETWHNPIICTEEPYFPSSKRKARIFAGVVVVLFMVALVIIYMIGVIVYKLLIFRPLFRNRLTQNYAFSIASVTGAILNLFCILILSEIYGKLAVVLTDWEMHRTQTEYDDNLTFKEFAFQFVNFYSSVIYIAFFKGRLIGFPGHYEDLFRMRQEECPPGGCLFELAQQLLIIMVGKQIIGNIKEILVPVIKTFFKKRWMDAHLGTYGKPPVWADDYYSLVENEGTFSEYLEMIIQFGFITIFVAAFPLAPLFALANNIFEIRIDSIKFVMETRRSVAIRVQDIGIWFDILTSISQIAVVSNAFLVAFGSNFLPTLLYKHTVSPNHTLTGYLNYSLAWAPPNSTKQPCRYRDFRDENGDMTKFYWHLLALRLGFVIIFEHIVFTTQRLIGLLIPDVPEELNIAILSEEYLTIES